MASKKNGSERDYCNWARGRKYVCPYQQEERTIYFCMCYKLRETTSQQDLLIKQNRIIINVLEQIKNILEKPTILEELTDYK
jgi:hypothetical protein